MIDRREAMEMVHLAFDRADEARAEGLRMGEVLFLAANALEEGVVETDSGLQFVVLTEGEGPRPEPGSVVVVHYEGTLTDGTVFDSSIERGRPETIPLGMVIPGWDEAIRLMSVGSTYRFYIPSHLAYGPRGAGGIIPPFATLVFEIELLEILDEDDLDAVDFW